MTTSAARPCLAASAFPDREQPLAGVCARGRRGTPDAAGHRPPRSACSPPDAPVLVERPAVSPPACSRRSRARQSVLLVLLALLTGCAAGTEQEVPSAAAEITRSAPTSDAAPPPGSGPTSRPPSPSAPASPTARTIDVSYVGGEVSGTTGREEAALGEQVVLRITSDVADEVHVHGYDLSQALPAGVPVEIPLTASLPGGYEVELHDAGLALFQLRVS